MALFDDEYKYDEKTARTLNPQVLAFVGDSVYSLFIRGIVAKRHDEKAGKLHLYTNQYVCASGQSSVIARWLPVLTEHETEVYKRARNYDTPTLPKNQSVVDYKRATGFEAVLGYLYLSGQEDRLNELLRLCVEK